MFERKGEVDDRFKKLGSSVFMVSASVGLAIEEVVRRARRLAKFYRRYSKLSDLLRDVASVEDAVLKLKAAERKAKG